LQQETGRDAILWGVVDATNYKLIPNSKFGVYENAVVGYRLLSP